MHTPLLLAAEIVARHPMVERIIPSVISVKGTVGGKTAAKVLRIITTAGDFLAGESLRCELNEMLSEAMDR